MKSIPFSAMMQAANLAGRKTQTRRGMNPQPSEYRVETVAPQSLRGEPKKHPRPYFDAYNGGPHWCWWDEYDRQGADWIKCPYGKAGDRLWVREEHYRFGHWEPVPGQTTRKKGRQKYRFVADSDEVRYFDNPPADFRKGMHHADPGHVGWYKRNARFMPRVLSRMTLEVLSIRVERVQDISEADAIAEGIFWSEEMEGFVADAEGRCFNGGCAVRAYEILWSMINGADSWEHNDWVWVIEYKIVTP